VKVTDFGVPQVPAEKVGDYLLSNTHPKGRHKAAAFLRFGFDAAAPEVLAAAPVNHALDHAIVKEEASPFGRRFVVEGALTTPDGRNPMVRSVIR
jgi:hypothetical protein